MFYIYVDLVDNIEQIVRKDGLKTSPINSDGFKIVDKTETFHPETSDGKKPENLTGRSLLKKDIKSPSS